MIDNVILLITGTLHERDTHELLERCHPLGIFDTMPALCVATNVEELFNTVLVETPLGMYFFFVRLGGLPDRVGRWWGACEGIQCGFRIPPLDCDLCFTVSVLRTAPYFANCLSAHDLDE